MELHQLCATTNIRDVYSTFGHLGNNRFTTTNHRMDMWLVSGKMLKAEDNENGVDENVAVPSSGTLIYFFIQHIFDTTTFVLRDIYLGHGCIYHGPFPRFRV